MPGSGITRIQKEICRQTGLLQSVVVASKSGVSVHSGQRIERVREALSPGDCRAGEYPLGAIW